MKCYELLFVLKPTLTDEEVVGKVGFIKEVLEKNEAQIESVLNIGTKKLAYPIKKNERGIYTVFYFKAPTQSIKEIERIIRLSEEIIKFMTVKYESKKEVIHWAKLVAKAEDKKAKAKAKEAKETEPQEA